MYQMQKWWQDKPLYGQYSACTTKDVDKPCTPLWLCRTVLKTEIEVFILAAHDQCLLSKNYQAHIKERKMQETGMNIIQTRLKA